MRRCKAVIATALFLSLLSQSARAQDPKLPPTNLGLSNMQDGKPPGTGWFFQQYIQSYQTQSNRGPEGNDIGGAKINSILSLSQLIWISKIKVAGGNLGFTVLVPLISLSATGGSGAAPSINPSPWGDIIGGPFIQWFKRHLFGMPLDHRLETDVVAPTGAYEQAYAVNPGSHLYSIIPHYTFTVFPANKFSISMRHMLTYNFNQIGTPAKPGAFYNFNYSFEYAVISSFRVEATGYYLTQFVQDSYHGDDHYYQQVYNIPDTRERVFAYGPGVGYVTPTGLFIELKGMWETAVRNRSEGFRGTLVLAYALKR